MNVTSMAIKRLVICPFSNITGRFGQDNNERLRELQTAVKSTFDQGIDRLAQSQMEASAALQGELAFQSDLLRQQLAQGNSEVVAARTPDV